MMICTMNILNGPDIGIIIFVLSVDVIYVEYSMRGVDRWIAMLIFNSGGTLLASMFTNIMMAMLHYLFHVPSVSMLEGFYNPVKFGNNIKSIYQPQKHWHDVGSAKQCVCYSLAKPAMTQIHLICLKYSANERNQPKPNRI